jgi:hypothetical protein
MKGQIERPADIPSDVYHFWHNRWCAILTAHHRQEILDAGLAGLSFTERMPDAPDGKGYFSYSFAEDGTVQFMDGEAGAVAEYESYEFGFRLLSDPTFDGTKAIEEGLFRIISEPEQWLALGSLIPILRTACHVAIEEAEEHFDLQLPKYW